MCASFADERSVFPFVHTVVNLAFYMCTRNFLLTVVAWYVWETIETFLSMRIASLVETRDDSLIGDPIIGLAAVLPFVILDYVTGFDVVFRRHAYFWSRVLVFVAIGAASFLATELQSTHFYGGVVLLMIIYLAAALIGFANLVFYSGRNNELRYAGQSVCIWLIAVVVQTIIAVVVVEPSAPLVTSSWMRAFLTSVAFLLASLAGLLVK